MSVAELLPPMRCPRTGDLHCDGCYVNNLPVREMRSTGCVRTVVGVSVVGRHASAGFDHGAAETFLANLDARLDGRATALLAQNGVTDLVDASYKLSCTLPKVISIPFDPSASRNVLRGTITDIAEAMSHARTLPLPDKDAWYTSRVADQNILDQTDQ